MADLYKIDLTRLWSEGCFSEVSRDELRVLVALISKDGRLESTSALAELAQVSRPRTASALALFCDVGVIKKVSEDGTRVEIVEEFEENPLADFYSEERSVDLAASIRDKAVQDMINDCAALMERPALNTQEIKCITAPIKDLALSPQYILTLAAHLKEKGSLTPQRLKNECARLFSKGIDTTEELEIYIQKREKYTPAVMEIRNMIGIYSRNLSDREVKYFRHWSEELGYSVAIIKIAFDIATANGVSAPLPYMNKLLLLWHEAGCKTVEECLAKSESDKNEKEKSKGQRSKAAKSKHPEASTPKYTDFDTEDALMRALERSYGEDKD